MGGIFVGGRFRECSLCRGLDYFFIIFGNVLGIDVGNNLYPLLVVNRFTFYLLYLSAALILV